MSRGSGLSRGLAGAFLPMFMFLMFPPRASGSSVAVKSNQPVVARHVLRPAPGSSFVLDEFELEFLAGGGRRISGRQLNREASISQRLFFMVDPKKLTYWTVALPQDAGDPLDTALFEDPPANCGELPSCLTPCDGHWVVRVETWDPALIVLTRTTASASWGEWGARSCVWHWFASGSCWAANPSSLGTHWYVSSCSSGSSGSQVYRQGTYYNYDFLLPNLSTSVYEFAEVHWTPLLGVGISWVHQDSGEASALIFGVLNQVGANNCF